MSEACIVLRVQKCLVKACAWRPSKLLPYSKKFVPHSYRIEENQLKTPFLAHIRALHRRQSMPEVH